MPTTLLTLLDDLATVLDDVAVMTKTAAHKAAGVIGDDLAVNAEQVRGISADRELGVVWAVAKGSALNKLILVPAALALGAAMPWAVAPLLMVGGAYLCFEGVEKVVHRWHHGQEHHQISDDEKAAAVLGYEMPADRTAPPPDRARPSPGEASKHASTNGGTGALSAEAFEQERIRGAVRTDFILSAEIIAITLGVVAQKPFVVQLGTLAGMAALMTVGVYGLVAGIVRLDDAGLYLSRREGDSGRARFARRCGTAILAGAPYLMRLLSLVGTIAMFLVGGGIVVHGIPVLYQGVKDVAQSVARAPGVGAFLEIATPIVLEGLVGVALGVLVLGLVRVVKRVMPPKPASGH